jgi:hypothetical protein
MTPEQIVELPNGFNWKELEDVGRIPTPESWFFEEVRTHPKVRSFFMTRERISDPGIIVAGDLIIAKTTEEGLFKTGVSLWVTENASSILHGSPTELAKSLIKDMPNVVSESDMEEGQNGRFKTFRRHFKIVPGITLGIQMSAKRLYMEAGGNDRVDRFYNMIFETPEGQWQTDQEIANVMFENRTFS